MMYNAIKFLEFSAVHGVHGHQGAFLHGCWACQWIHAGTVWGPLRKSGDCRDAEILAGHGHGRI